MVGIDWETNGTTFAGENGVPPIVSSVSVSPCGDGVCVAAEWIVYGQKSDASCCQFYNVSVQQKISPALSGVGSNFLPSSVSWTSVYTAAQDASSLPWRTTLGASVDFSGSLTAADARYFVPRSGNESASVAGTWEDVLRVLSESDGVNTTALQYGINMLCAPGDSACCGQLLSVPLTLSASAAQDAGVGVVAALDDAIFGLSVDLTATATTFSRLFNRLGEGGRAVSTTYHLVPVAGVDWRPLFAWGRATFPRFFLPPTLLAAATTAATSPSAAAASLPAAARAPAPIPPILKAGLGLYTCANAEDLNLTQVIAQSGATHNWDAHFAWPYIGMYLPPISPADASWQSNIGPGEEPNCGPHYRHGQDINISAIKAEYAAAKAVGITTLAYFNLAEYGENFSATCSLPAPISPPPENDWVGAAQYLSDHLGAEAIWPGCLSTGWQSGVIVNPAAPSFSDFLVSQAQLFLDSLGADNFFGFAVDRLDHLTLWGHGISADLDDGLAWCGAPCILFMTGFNAALARVAAVVYSEGGGGERILTGNFVGSQRIDALQHFDGVNTEDYTTHLRLLYATGLCTTGKPPAFIWTYTAAEILSYTPNPDAYFAQHVALRLFPYAPALGNDHSIQPQMDPTGQVQGLYTAWGPLFVALQGTCWWLASFPVRLEAATGAPGGLPFSLNGFTSGGGCTDVTTLGGNGPVSQILAFATSSAFTSSAGATISISIADPFEGATPSACDAIVPGASAWAMVPLPVRNATSGRWFFEPIALARGAALLRCSR